MADIGESLKSAGIGDAGIRLVRERLAETSQSARIERALRRFLDARDGATEGLDADRLEAFIDLVEQSDHAANSLIRYPRDLDYVTRRCGEALGVEEVVAAAESELKRLHRGELDAREALYGALRNVKRRESLRIFLREVRRAATMRETTAEIADLAAGTLRVAVQSSAANLGPLELARHFCVLGMGKLGGRELNFSSDVDLIYVCSEAAKKDEQLRTRVDALARAVTAAMEESTEDGYVFRVDLRLRPEGSQGALVHAGPSMVEYYRSWGRTWERSALMKARPVAGELAIGETVLEELDSFIYRKYLDYTAIDELRSMKEKVNQSARLAEVVGTSAEDDVESESEKPTSSLKSRLKRKMRTLRTGRRRVRVDSSLQPPGAEGGLESSAAGDPSVDSGGVLGWDVKIGVGGIREIEFFVQALQLVHCGTRPGLRVRNTLDALDRLLYAGLISHDDHAALADAYDWLRRLEHRVQMEHDRQSHRLPSERSRFGVLAERLGMGAEDLRELVLQHRRDVSRIFDRLFRDSARDPKSSTVPGSTPGSLDTFLGADSEQLDEPAVRKAIRELGFERPRQVAGQLQILREKRYGPFAEHATTEQRELGEYLVESCAGAPDPDQAFSYLTRFMTAVGDRPGYFRMLRENPHATRLLVHVFGSSTYLATSLIHDPNTFERLLGVGTIAVVRSRAEIARDLRNRLRGVEDPGHRQGIVRRFHQEENLRIGLHETGGAAEIDETLHQLSLLAEVVMNQLLEEVYEPLRTRRRRPGSVLPPLEEVPFAVVAMGKLGGRELGFGSDLDIIFVYEPFWQYKLEHTFFARLAQRFVRALSTTSEEGKLYEVDTRLRPSGRQGALVVSSEAFETYHEETARLWERQALIRARPIIGPRELRRAVLDVRRRFAFERDLPEDAVEQIRDMRTKIQEANYEPGMLDVKFSPGGLIDVEFVTQLLQLKLGREDVRDESGGGLDVVDGICSQSTSVALEALARRADVGFDVDRLHRDYIFLRRVEARLRVAELRGATVIPDDDERRTVLARRLGYQGTGVADALVSDIREIFGRVREITTAIFTTEV